MPITARKLEALVRLAEASARVRLSDTVEVEDTELVIDIVRACLKDIGVDPETGQFDADLIETGTSMNPARPHQEHPVAHPGRSKTSTGWTRPSRQSSCAAEAGIDEAKVEHEIEKLPQRGEVHEPVTGHLRTT